MEPLSLAVGAGLLVVGFVLGRLRRPGRSPAPPVNLCECGHVFSMHDPDSKRCHQINNWDAMRCPCRHYNGPLPVGDLLRLKLPED